MAQLEDLKPGTKLKEIIPGQSVSVVDCKWHGSTAVELVHKRADGQPGTQLLFRNDEPNIEVVEARRAWQVVQSLHQRKSPRVRKLQLRQRQGTLG